MGSKRKKSSKGSSASSKLPKTSNSGASAIEFNSEDMRMFARFAKARRMYEEKKTQGSSSSSSFMTSPLFMEMMGGMSVGAASGTGGPVAEGASTPAAEAKIEGASALDCDPEPPEDIVPNAMDTYRAMWNPESTSPLRGHYPEQSYHAVNIGRHYDAKLKAFVDTVMRVALKTHLSPGITITKQKHGAMAAWFRHIALKMPQGCFRAERNRSSVKARLRAKLQRDKRRRSKGVSAPPPTVRILYICGVLVTFTSTCIVYL